MFGSIYFDFYQQELYFEQLLTAFTFSAQVRIASAVLTYGISYCSELMQAEGAMLASSGASLLLIAVDKACGVTSD